MKILTDVSEARALKVQLSDCKERILANKQQIDKSLKILKPLFEYHLVRDINTDIYWKLSSLISKYEKAIDALEARDQMLAEATDAVVETINEIKDNFGSNIIRNAEAAELLKTINPPRQIQIREVTPSGKEMDQDGRCNVSAMTTLLNRKYALDSINSSEERINYFTPTDVLEANGCTNINQHGKNEKGQHLYSYEGRTGDWYNSEKKYTNSEGVTYSPKRIGIDEAKRVVNNEYGRSYEEYIAHLLDEHPEGIAIRNNDASHVAVITRYERTEDGIQIYVNDPVNIKKPEQRIEDAWVSTVPEGRKKRKPDPDLWDDVYYVYLNRGQ